MARNESDREDLMREATALRRRVELSVPDEPEEVIAGFREDGRISLFFGADPAYHFDAEGRLRRSYSDGALYRTQGETLARLTRQRTPDQSHLLRYDLPPEELARFLHRMDERLAVLHQRLLEGRVETIRQIPETPPLIPDILDALARIRNADQRLAPAIKA